MAEIMRKMKLECFHSAPKEWLGDRRNLHGPCPKCGKKLIAKWEAE
jgi:predicted RNA-binding Zn-ribbon protein involved in translation (DUF1610 family)